MSQVRAAGPLAGRRLTPVWSLLPHPAARPCEPDCGGHADYAAVPCPNPACAERVAAAWGPGPAAR